MFTLTFVAEQGEVKVATAPGRTVMEAAAAAGLALDAPCGGRGTCGKCLVRVISGELEPPGGEELDHLGQEELADGLRLGCQARLAGPATIGLVGVLAGRVLAEGEGRPAELAPGVRRVLLQVAEPTLEEGRGDLERVLAELGGVRVSPGLAVVRDLPAAVRAEGGRVSALVAGEELVGVSAGHHPRCLGMAVDVGTTTVVGYLLDLETGEQVGMASAMNEQAAFGADLISRIGHAAGGGGRELQQRIVGVINRLLEAACKQAGERVEDVCELTVVGNTCMHHLLLGLPVDNLAAMPFVPAATSALRLSAREIGLAAHPEARVYCFPNVAGFVGADAVAVMLASGFGHQDGLRVAIDIGTNGEVMAARGGEIVACSTAAGPAFEGAKISRGMRAAPGAIDRVRLTPQVQVHTIEGAPASGACGSGIIDAVAELVKLGVVEENGRMLSKEALPAWLPAPVAERLVEEEGKPAFLLAEGELGPVLLTARDVREAQLAKAALAAGLAVVLDELGAGAGEIEQLLLAGAFGNYIDRRSAVVIGLIPDLPEGRIKPVGNAAGAGARLGLLSVRMRAEAERLAAGVRHLELSSRPDFYDRFTDAMMLRPVPAQGQ